MKKVFSKKIEKPRDLKIFMFFNFFLKILYEENFETPEG